MRTRLCVCLVAKSTDLDELIERTFALDKVSVVKGFELRFIR